MPLTAESLSVLATRKFSPKVQHLKKELLALYQCGFQILLYSKVFIHAR